MIFQRAPGACADASDRRLKRDIELVRTFPDGLRLYRFRYVTDHRPFMSVVAQELLEDARIALAVLGSACGSSIAAWVSGSPISKPCDKPARTPSGAPWRGTPIQHASSERLEGPAYQRNRIEMGLTSAF
jgi:hypothetical protein